MTLETGLYSYLKGQAAVNAVTGNRIYPIRLPQNVTFPAIAYTRISGQRVHVMGAISGVASPRIQIICWAETYGAAKDLAEIVRLVLDNYSGAMGGTTVIASLIDDDADMEDAAPNTGRKLYGVRTDYEIWHREATS